MANVQGTFYRGETQRSGVTPTSPPNAGDDPVGPLNPPGSGNTTTYKQLGDTTDKSFIGKNGYVPVVVNENQLTLQPLPNADQDGLISGGIVQWTGTDYDFNVSAALARFQGVAPLVSDDDILTSPTSDPSNPRIDNFILQVLFDGDGIPNGIQPAILDGVPAVNPVKRQINPATQIELTQVLVLAGSTTPTLTEEVIYDENTEWTGTTSGTGTGVFNSAVDPYQGAVSVETTNIQNAFQVQFNNGSEIDISTYQTFGFQINLKASLGANQNLYVTFLDGSLAPVSNFVLINLNKSLTGYQFIGIALNSVNFTSFDVQYIRFSFVRTSGPTTFSGYFLDIVKLEGGIAPPVTQNTFLNLTDTPSTYSGQGNKVVSVKADETGLEFTTASGGGLPPIDGSYASQAAMIADQGNQTAQYIYYDSTEYWEYLGTTTPSIADYRALSSGGGADTNAVHYDAADGKNSTEKQQARDNIGLNSGIPQFFALVSNFAAITRTSNYIIIDDDTGPAGISSMTPGTDGEIVTIENRKTVGLTFQNNTGGTVGERFQIGSSFVISPGQRASFAWNSDLTAWQFDEMFYQAYLRKDIQDTAPLGARLEGVGNTSGSAAPLIVQQTGANINNVIASFRNNSNTLVAFVSNSGKISIARSGATAPFTTMAVRRDEQHYKYLISVTTAGVINDLALADGNFNTRFTAATNLNGMSGGEIGRTLLIQNDSGGNLTIGHENVGSAAANRFNLIGAADLVVPTKGKLTVIYCTGSRWELVSKNF